ncbi:MAG: response regulator [Candidatus Omnitrophota bacterium]
MEIFSTFEISKICNVHHTTVICWIKEKKLLAYLTPGGHRRVKKEDLLDFMCKFSIPIPDTLARSNKSILVVDDDREALDELSSALRAEGFEVNLAFSGFEAGKKVYVSKPDLILLDFMMPGMDGFEVCSILKSDKETASIPIIAVTALNGGDEVEKIKKCGVKLYFSKPLDLARLIKAVRDVLKISCGVYKSVA